MRSYLQALKEDWKSNEVAQVLAFVAICLTIVYVSLTIGAPFTIYGVSNIFLLPFLFALLSLIHFLTRPAVRNYYSTKDERKQY